MKRKSAQAAALRAWLTGAQAELAGRQQRGEGVDAGAVLIIEVGCGQSIHSLRVDSEIALSLLLSAGGHVLKSGGGGGGKFLPATLVRIDPAEASVPQGHIAVQAGAAEALTAVHQQLCGL